MDIKIALAGNPNSGKTTLFNALTGSNQFVGNWPGVTVEKKEGKLKKHDGVIVTDLPGIYSLSPYTSEEVVARNYLVDEEPDAILDIIDGTNLERNLYLTTQLLELGIPVVIAINMMDVIRRNGDEIDISILSKTMGCPIIEISALKGEGIMEAAEAAIKAAEGGRQIPHHIFSGPVEHALAHIEEAVVHDMPLDKQRWYAIKIFERDEKVLQKLQIPEKTLKHVEEDIRAAEEELDDDAEGIIANDRYNYISEKLKTCYKRKNEGQLSASDKIDKIVTSRWLGLPIFALIMFFVYWFSMVAVGAAATDWANDGLFGDGYHLFGIGTGAFEEAEERYGDTDVIIEAFAEEYGVELDEDDMEGSLNALLEATPEDAAVTYIVQDEETLATEEFPNTGKDVLEEAVSEYLSTEEGYKSEIGAPDPAAYGVWVPGIPVIAETILDKMNTADWLKGLIVDGIIGGVGSVLGFVPQMFTLFLLLACLEACGYMARIAFVLDRIFRKFGLSGKSFIAMLIGTGCGVPGIMASRTIENENDKRMTIITTTFIPCSAKVPFIGMVAGAIFGGSAWVATSAYFVGMAAIIISGLMLKKTKLFAGEASPFVMELPAYHWPTPVNVLRSMWERGWGFIKKAGTVVLLSTVLLWFLSRFGFAGGSFGMVGEDQLDVSLLAMIGNCISWVFIPLGWGTWQAAVASVTGLIAKENIVGTMGVLYGGNEAYANMAQVFNGVSAYSFLVFNLLCAPCFAAIGAIKREMNSAKWTWIAIGWECGFAYVIALMIYQFGSIFTGNMNIIGLIAALAVLCGMIYMLFIKKYKEAK
jgi:ferrous iron transport protein B